LLRAARIRTSLHTALRHEVDSSRLIVLDEVDSLLPPSPALPPPAISHLLSRLFSLPLLSTNSFTVKFIAISNTLDLTVRARLILPTGTQPQVLPFKAYGTNEMIDIVNSRIASAAINRPDFDTVKVDLKAIELLSRKVEAQNGDLRMCLASLTSAANLAEAEWVKKTFTTESDAIDPPCPPLVKIAMPHIIKAFGSHTQKLKAAAGSSSSSAGGPTARKIRSVPLQGKMVLVSIIIYLTRCRVGLPGCPSVPSNASSPNSSPNKHGDLTTSALYATYSYLLSATSSPFPPAPESDYRDLLSNLETLGLISLFGGSSASMSRSASAGSRGKVGAGGPRVELCATEEEIKLGLGIDGRQVAGGIADEEVGRVWDREDARVVKAREKLARAVEVLAGVQRDD
jgi:cell division control protein 6